jgi:hypothetical protein
MQALSGLVHQIISVDAAETAPQKLLRRSEAYLNRPGVAARSTTSDHLVVLEGPAQPIPTKPAVSSFGRYSNARL